MWKKHLCIAWIITALCVGLLASSTFFPEFYRSFSPELGGWSTYRSTDRTGGVITLTFAVVEQEEGHFWLEIRSEEAGAEGIASYLLKGDPSDDGNVMKIRVQNEPGTIMEFDRATLDQLQEIDPQAFGGKDAQSIGPTMGKLRGFPDEKIKVGRRNLKCSHVKVVGKDAESEVWIHDSVVPFGIVRLKSGTEEVVLTDFGGGAKPKMSGTILPIDLSGQ